MSLSAKKIIDIARGRQPDLGIMPVELPKFESVDIETANIDSKIASARFFGEQEIEKFRASVQKFVEETEGLILFSSIGMMVKKGFVDLTVDEVIEPMLRGDDIHGLSSDSDEYLNMREELYRSLIQRYVDKVDGNAH